MWIAEGQAGFGFGRDQFFLCIGKVQAEIFFIYYKSEINKIILYEFIAL